MADSTGGMGAEVGVRKMDSDGNTVQEEGAVDSGVSKWSWLILFLLIVLSSFGVWKVLELIALL